MTIDMVQILLFIGAILLITLTFIGLGFMIPEALPGATMALGMAGIVFLVALSLYMIEGLTFENVGAFMLAIGGLAVGLALLLPELLVGVVSAALLVVVGLGVLLFAGAMLAIMELEIDPKKIDGFTSGITSIMTAFNSFGVIEVAKAVLKAVALVPIIAVSLLAALTFSAIEKLDLSEGKIGAFGTFLAQFIQVTTTEISKSVQGLKDAEPGIKALSLLVNVGADLARLITDFSNMNYNEYGWKDGKLQIINVRKLTDTEIAQVGVNFGKLIQGLLVPLTVMSSDDEFWDFGGGVKVKNIFKDGFFGDNNSGVNRLAKIANAFKPLVEGIASLANLNMSQDPKMLENFKLSLSTSMSSITDAFDKLENWKNDKSSTSIDLITKLAKSLKEFDNFTSISDGMEKFLNNLADEDKWSKINKNLQGLNENFASIAKNINSIEIDKALALEKNLKLMTDKESSDNLSVVVANLKEMIGMITASQQQQTQVIASMFPQQTLLPEENKTETVNPIWSDIKELMKQIGDKIEGTNNKLSGKLKVTMVNANDPNQIGG